MYWGGNLNLGFLYIDLVFCLFTGKLFVVGGIFLSCVFGNVKRLTVFF